MQEEQLKQLKQSVANAINNAGWGQARSDLLQIVQADDGDHYAKYQLGYCHLMLNDVDKAIQCLKESIANDSGVEHAYIVLSHAQVLKRDFIHAIETLQQLTKMFPSSAEGYGLLGGAYMQNLQYIEAEECLNRSISINPGQNNVRLHLGTLQLHLCKYKSSITNLKIVLEAGEYTGEVHNLLARAYQNSEDYENAITHYEAAIQLMPGVDDPVINLGVVQRKMRGHQEEKAGDGKQKPEDHLKD